MALNILFRIYVLKEKLQVHTAHKLTTSAELFYKIYGIIEQNPRLAAEFTKKLESKGFQELQFTEGRRYIVRANNSAGRGIAAPHPPYVRYQPEPDRRHKADGGPMGEAAIHPDVLVLARRSARLLPLPQP